MLFVFIVVPMEINRSHYFRSDPCIRQKFSIWPLPGALQLSLVFSTIATSFFKYWPSFLTRILLVLVFDPLGFIIMLNIFPIYAFQRFCVSSLVHFSHWHFSA